jgi:myosin heavy subunit
MFTNTTTPDTDSVKVNAAKGVSSMTTPADVVNAIQALRNEHLLLIQQSASLSTDKKLLQNKHKEAAELLQVTKSQVKAADETVETMRANQVKSERRIQLLQKENQSLKDILKTFDNEGNMQNDISNASAKSRVEILEDTLAAKENHIKLLEIENKKLDEVTAENKLLLKHLQLAESEAARLEKFAKNVDYDIKTTKVLHLKINPKFEAESRLRQAKDKEISTLKQEVQTLTTRLLHIPSTVTSSDSQSASTMVDDPLSEAGSVACKSESSLLTACELELKQEKQLNTTLKDKLTESDKKLNRLKSAYMEKAQLLLQTCYLAFGYKVEMHENRIHLRSMYAEKEGDVIVIQKKSDVKGAEGLDVLETDFIKTLPAHVMKSLSQFHSIPLFTATVLQYLFESTTKMI